MQNQPACGIIAGPFTNSLFSRRSCYESTHSIAFPEQLTAFDLDAFVAHAERLNQPLPMGFSPRSVAVGDVDDDGMMDLATANAESDNVSVLLGTGAFSPNSPLPFSVGSSPRAVAVATITGNRFLDLVTANAGPDSNSEVDCIANSDGNAISLLLNGGSGTFNLQLRFAVGRRPRNVGHPGQL